MSTHILHETGDSIAPLIEKAVRSDGTVPIKIIQPGWGSSGYYSEELLQRDIPQVFPAGTHMFWNHDTATEEAERPEGDLSRLAAVTVTDPVWMENGPKGPGMYADAIVFSDYRETVDQIGEYIGVSIRGRGRHVMGEAEGRKGPIIDEIVAGKSIDFVTVPGAGGEIVQIFEAARPTENDAQQGDEIDEADTAEMQPSEVDMELQEQLEQANGRIAELETERESMNEQLVDLQQQLVETQAREIVTARLGEAELPAPTVARLQRQLLASVPVSEGALNESALGESITAAIDEARAEIAAVRESGTYHRPR
jgi:hypothetical protein